MGRCLVGVAAALGLDGFDDGLDFTAIPCLQQSCPQLLKQVQNQGTKDLAQRARPLPLAPSCSNNATSFQLT